MTGMLSPASKRERGVGGEGERHQVRIWRGGREASSEGMEGRERGIK